MTAFAISVAHLSEAPDPLLRLWWFQSGLADKSCKLWTPNECYLAREIVWRWLEDLQESRGVQ